MAGPPKKFAPKPKLKRSLHDALARRDDSAAGRAPPATANAIGPLQITPATKHPGPAIGPEISSSPAAAALATAASVTQAADDTNPLMAAATAPASIPRTAAKAGRDASAPPGRDGMRPLATSCSAALRSVMAINVSAVDAVRASSLAALQFFEALLGARSAAEAMRLQQEHARKQFAAATGPARELTAAAWRWASSASSSRADEAEKRP